MKHLVTISFVLFSLTHLAKAERAEGLRILNEYCKEHQIKVNHVVESSDHFKEQLNPYFSAANNNLIGDPSQLKSAKYIHANQLIADLAIRKKPKNNSP